MASKEIITYEVTDPAHDYTAKIPVGVAKGDVDGPGLAVIGGVHGTEYAAQDATVEFWDEIDASTLKGSVRVVLCADTAALEGHSAYVNPIDGQNLNRMWPGDPEGSLTQRIAHCITSEVIEKCDAVIDVHGGEWDEDIDCFIITHSTGDDDLDKRTLDLSMALGFTYVEVTDAHGPILGVGTGSGEAVKGGRPALTLEAGGTGLRERRFIDAHKYALRNALRHLGIVDGRAHLVGWPTREARPWHPDEDDQGRDLRAGGEYRSVDRAGPGVLPGSRLRRERLGGDHGTRSRDGARHDHRQGHQAEWIRRQDRCPLAR